MRSKHKLSDKWEQDVVDKQAGNLPVYNVKSEDDPGRTLHRDVLLPSRFLSITEKEEI